jgi:dethiobiotin synthetase
MTSRLVVVAGTGTEIGKTHFAEALLRALAGQKKRVLGLKPIESGLLQPAASDSARLERSSTFHVEPFGYSFAEPLSPHLAARRSGETIHLEPLVAAIDAIRTEVDIAVVELPGGLFTPLSDTVVNADFARDLDPDLTLLVAPDRLGALNDVLVALRAAETVPLPISGIILVTPERRDLSTGHNGPELRRLVPIPLAVTLPRADVDELAHHDAIHEVVAFISS